MNDGQWARDEGDEDAPSSDSATQFSEPIDSSAEEHAPKRFRLRAEPSTLITSARRSAYEDRRKRTKWYLIIQMSRIPTTALAGISYFWWDNVFLTVLFFVLAVPAPAIAVVYANERGAKKDKRTRNVYKPGVARQMAREQLADPTQTELPKRDETAPDDNLPAVIDHEDSTDSKKSTDETER